MRVIHLFQIMAPSECATVNSALSEKEIYAHISRRDQPLRSTPSEDADLAISLCNVIIMSQRNVPKPLEYPSPAEYQVAFCQYVVENPDFVNSSAFRNELISLQETVTQNGSEEVFEDSFWPEVVLVDSPEEENTGNEPEPDKKGIGAGQHTSSSSETVPSVDSTFLSDRASTQSAPLIDSIATGRYEEMELQQIREVAVQIGNPTTPRDRVVSRNRRNRDQREIKRLVMIIITIITLLFLAAGCEWTNSCVLIAWATFVLNTSEENKIFDVIFVFSVHLFLSCLHCGGYETRAGFVEPRDREQNSGSSKLLPIKETHQQQVESNHHGVPDHHRKSEKSQFQRKINLYSKL